MIDLHRLAVLHLVATHGGYSRAARAAPYPITQPALHQQVKKLEQEVGVPLLERIAKDRMRPTPAGERLLAFADPFFRELPTVVAGLRAGDFAGKLSLQAESMLIRQLLPAWMLALRRARPGIEVHLAEFRGGDAAPLLDGRVDALVAHLPDVPNGVATQVVAQLHPVLVVPRERIGKTKRAPRLAELADLPFLAYPVGSRAHVLQMQALAQSGVAPSQVMALDTADAILGFVESGLGWSLVPSLDPKGPTGRRLAAFPFTRFRRTFPVYLAWRKDAPASPMLDALIECAPTST